MIDSVFYDRRMMMTSLITAKDISLWCHRVDARHTLSELVLRLILASTNNGDILKIRIPTREAAGLPGWDGILECNLQTTEIPSGRSVWELGTSEDARDKIKEDWEKRLKNPNLPTGWSPKEVTFVAVSGHCISDPDGFEESLKNNNNNSFKDFRILDAVALAKWICCCPNVDVWLRDEHKVGLPVAIKYLISWAEDWQKMSKPPIVHKLLLAGRKENEQSLLQQIRECEESPRKISVLADSPDEAVAFVAATLKGAVDRESPEATYWRRWRDRAVLCCEPSSLDLLSRKQPLLWILKDSAISMAHPLVREGHTVITIPGNEDPRKRQENDINWTLDKPAPTTSGATLPR